MWHHVATRWLPSCARRTCKLHGAGAGVQEAISSHVVLVLRQFEQHTMPEASGACCELFFSPSDVDLRLQCTGGASAGRTCAAMSCWCGPFKTQRGAESAAARDIMLLQHTATFARQLPAL
jgi:hypothetical protein